MAPLLKSTATRANRATEESIRARSQTIDSATVICGIRSATVASSYRTRESAATSSDSAWARRIDAASWLVTNATASSTTSSNTWLGALTANVPTGGTRK